MPTPKARLMGLVELAVQHIGGRERLAHFLGVTPNAITEWRKGRSAPNAEHLMRMQDLVKRAACVLIALAGLTQAPHSGATAGAFQPTRSGDTSTPAPQRNCETLRLPHCATFWTLLWHTLGRMILPKPLLCEG